MKRKISVAGIQLLHEQGCRDANIQAAVRWIESAPGHDLYVLPELASSGYGRDAFEQLDRLTEDSDGPSFQAFSALAQKQRCFICYCFPRKTKHGKPTICAAVVDRDGRLAALYDKWHVCQNGDSYEKEYFAAGVRPLGVFTIDQIRVGICICYDIRFPEMIRKLAIEQRIALLIHPGGWPRLDEGFNSWHSFVTTRAIENAIYIMSPNRASSENGCSIFCPPYVDFRELHPTVLKDPDAEGVLVGEVDIDYLEQVRGAYSLLSDRRPEMYNA